MRKGGFGVSVCVVYEGEKIERASLVFTLDRVLFQVSWVSLSLCDRFDADVNNHKSQFHVHRPLSFTPRIWARVLRFSQPTG